MFSKGSLWLSFAATFFFATSQWNLVFARSGYEAVVALLLAILNIYLLFRGVEKKSSLSFYLAFLFAYLSALSYSSNKVFIPLINLFFVILNWTVVRELFLSELKTKRMRLLFFSVLYLLIILFFIKYYILGPGTVRAKMVLFTGDFEYKKALMDKLGEYGLSVLGFPMLILFWFKRFLEYFSLNFYLIDGLGLTIPGHPGVGVINFALFPLYLLGLLSVLLSDKNDPRRKDKVFLLGWLLIGFLPATVANNAQHPLRSLNSSIAVIFLSTLGLSMVIDFICRRSRKFIYIFLVVFFAVFSFDFVRFVDYFTVHYPHELSETRGYGWKEMALYAEKVHLQYDNVYIDPRFGTEGRTSYGVPYSYFLFYSRYDPHTYHIFPGRNRFISDFENYHFLELDFNQKEPITGNNLYIASPWSFPSEMIREKFIVNEVKFLNGHTGFYAITNKPSNEDLPQK